MLPALPVFLALVSCATVPVVPTTGIDPANSLHAKNLDFEDGRARFREIFCAILADHGHELPDYEPCEEALVSTNAEPPGRGKPVDLGPSDKAFLIGLVPGLGWQCVRKWLDNDRSGSRHVSKYGYDVRLFEVDGLSGIENNAGQMRQQFAALSDDDKERPVILIGYSKGAIDVLQAVTRYPEIRERVVAVVSVAGAVGGSPLAENASQATMNLLAYLPKSGCETGDKGAVESLRPETRRKWFSENPLPDSIRYYSVIAYSDPEHISFGLKPFYRELAAVDGRNDGKLIFYDQLIPGATLLALVNADHWAMSIPVARQKPLNRSTFASQNEYPREALLEAILRYVEEDLAERSLPQHR
ncbi:MAG: hypothetical protein ABFS23_00205 [Pseudomonadota bacterium]